MKRWLATLILVSSLAIGQSTDNFELVSFECFWEGPWLKYTYELKNSSSLPSGVQLQVVFRDADGKAVDGGQPWPAGVSNIQPFTPFVGTGYGTERTDAASCEVYIINVRQW